MAKQKTSGSRTSRARGGAYSGRLAFDPESGFHLAEDGRKVVTEDAGKTWRYVKSGDTSHLDRYHQNPVVVDTTANEHARLIAAHGEDRANDLVSPHHWEAQPGDLHYDPSSEGMTQSKLDPDDVAETITSHTEAYA